MNNREDVTVLNRETETHSAHQRVEDADGERGAAGERLRHVQLGAWVVVVVLVQKLHIGVITCSVHTTITIGAGAS